MYFCDGCLNSGRWSNEKSTGNCQKCGQNRPRMRTWTTAMYENPLREFLEWLLFGLPGGRFRQPNLYAIAHYGG